ncbi:MAG: Ig-like domain-containing protein, partial [Rhodospirillaceae bacterium]
DLGRGDLGRGDLGRGDLGRGDLGRGDLGRGDLGRGDLGRGDLGGGDLFVGNPYKEGELDAETAGDLARTPPNTFTACVIGVNCAGSGSPLHAVSLGWKAPNVGGVLRYEVYRVAGGTLLPGTPWTAVGAADAVPGQVTYALVDHTQLTNGALYTYFAVAVYADGVQSDPSNFVTITAVNEPPAAGADVYATAEDTPLSVPAPGVLANDGDPDSPAALTAVLVAPLTAGTGTLTLNANGSFVYTPAANFFGSASFAYKAIATYGDGQTAETNTATVTITVSSVNDAPVAVNDTYPMPWPLGTALTIPAPGVLGNDTDVEGSPLTAQLASGPSNGAVTLNTNGSFTYKPGPTVSGSDSFTYRVYDGSATSAQVATVRIVAYSLVGTQNVPPAAVSKAKTGSTVPMKWQFKDGSQVVNSSAVHHTVTVKGTTTTYVVSDTDPGSSSFRYDATTNTWYFNLQTKDASGVAYPIGDYMVTITPTTPGYLPSPSFKLTLTK